MKIIYRKSESGSAGVKILLFLVVLFLIGNAGYNYIPTAYNSENLKQEMHAAVLQGMSVPPSTGTPVDVTKRRLQIFARANDVPPDAYIEVKQVNNLLQARIAYVKSIPVLPFGIYDYQYRFDYTANVNGYLAKQ